MAGVRDATDRELLAELESRGLVVSVWSREDALETVRQNTVGGQGEERVVAAADLFLRMASQGPRDVLGQRGNDYLTEKPDEVGGEVWDEVYGTEDAPKGP